MTPARLQDLDVRKGTSPEGYLFVNNIRFCSMVAVVLVHCALQNHLLAHTAQTSYLCKLLILILKFGTISFFLVSGFLAGERLEQRKPIDYLKQRMRNVFLPWLFWGTLWCAIIAVLDIRHGKLSLYMLHGILPALWHYVEAGIFITSFWFVPNLIFALCVLLVLRSKCSNAVTGGILLACSLFYAANIYGKWLPSVHTEAMCGFIFYIWLGMWGARNFEAIQNRLARVSMQWLVLFALLTLLASIKESQILSTLNVPDDLNTLRLSNQLYSLAVTLILLKLRRPVSPRFIQVRETTFGIYLTHVLALWMVSSAFAFLMPHFGRHGFWLDESLSLVIALTMFAATYTIALTMVWGLLASPTLRWIVYPLGKRSRLAAASTS